MTDPPRPLDVPHVLVRTRGFPLVWLVPALAIFLPGFSVAAGTIGTGLGIAALLGLVAGAVPAWQSARLSVVEALRHVG